MPVPGLSVALGIIPILAYCWSLTVMLLFLNLQPYKCHKAVSVDRIGDSIEEDR